MSITKLNMVALDGGGVIIPPAPSSNWRYFDVSKAAEEDKAEIVSTFAQIIRVMVQTNDFVCPPCYVWDDITQILAFGFDSSAPYRHPYRKGCNTIGEAYIAIGGNEAFNSLGIIEITEDEFLNKTFE